MLSCASHTAKDHQYHGQLPEATLIFSFPSMACTCRPQLHPDLQGAARFRARQACPPTDHSIALLCTSPPVACSPTDRQEALHRPAQSTCQRTRAGSWEPHLQALACPGQPQPGHHALPPHHHHPDPSPPKFHRTALCVAQGLSAEGGLLHSTAWGLRMASRGAGTGDCSAVSRNCQVPSCRAAEAWLHSPIMLVGQAACAWLHSPIMLVRRSGC